MPHPTRQVIAWIGTTLLILLMVYPLSQAPVLRLRMESRGLQPHEFMAYDEVKMSFYRPVDWLVDNTPLRSPMSDWAELWGVDIPFWALIRGREYYRDRPEFLY